MFVVNVGQHIPYIDIYIYLYIYSHIYNMLIYVSPFNKQIAPEKGWLE